MKKNIHPKLYSLNVFCSTCNKEHKIETTVPEISIDVCSNCHAMYTGDRSTIKSTGRVERFNQILKKKK